MTHATHTAEFLAKRLATLTDALVATAQGNDEHDLLNLLDERDEVLTALEKVEVGPEAARWIEQAIEADEQLRRLIGEELATLQGLLSAHFSDLRGVKV